jgi:type II secretory pathway pseudopilin PulG
MKTIGPISPIGPIRRPSRHRSAYTLIEVLVAAGVLLIAVSAAAALALATVTQEETSARVARCLDLHEQAARLYQLGLDPSTVTNILPVDPASVSLVFTTQSLAIPNLGTVDQATTTLTYLTTPQAAAWTAGSWTGGESSTTGRRTSTLTVIRPSLR